MRTALILALLATACYGSDELPFSVAYTDSSGAEVLIVHPEVGVRIDPPERERYGLFQDVASFAYAEYVRHPDGMYTVRLSIVDDQGQPVETREPTSAEVLLYINGKISAAQTPTVSPQAVVVDSVGDQAMGQLTRALAPVVDPNITRLMLTPTGHPLAVGRGYFADHLLFFPEVAYGATDRLALWGGCSLLPGVAISEQLFYFGTKTLLHTLDSGDVSAGALFVTHKELDDPLGLLYGVGTLGGSDASLTLLVGYGFEGTNLAEKPLVVLGGTRRLGRRTFFIGEIPFYSDVPLFPLFGIRRYSEDGNSHWIVGYPILVGYSLGFGGD